MAETKQIRRLATSAAYGDAIAGQVPTVRLTEHKDGGPYDLHPVVSYGTDTAILLLPHPDAPAYALGFELDAGAAGRLGRALVGIQRRLEGDTSADADA